MTMQAVYLKENEGIVHNSVGQLSSSVSSAPWWSAFGSQSTYGESCGQTKPFSLEIPNYVDQISATKQAPGRGAEQLLDKGHATQFTIFSGDTQKPQAAISLQSSVTDQHGRFEPRISQPMICAKYPYMDQFYGVFSTYGPQISGRIMLPLNLTSDDGPIYVNAKQYHGIIRRRQSREKAVMQSGLTKRRKPYMHESRHIHAMRRPRGCGGRFLNTRNLSNAKNGKTKSEVNEAVVGQPLHSSGSQSSEVLQSEGATLNSSKETNRSSPNIPSSEVTSMYSRGGFNNFVNHLGPSVHSLADMMDRGHGMVVPMKWIAAAGNCCNLEI